MTFDPAIAWTGDSGRNNLPSAAETRKSDADTESGRLESGLEVSNSVSGRSLGKALDLPAPFSLPVGSREIDLLNLRQVFTLAVGC